MRTIILKLLPITVFLFAFNFSFSQVYEMDLVNGQTISSCKGRFVDSDNWDDVGAGCPGTNTYCKNENYTVTFDAGSPAQRVRLNFLFYNIETGFDILTFYDGPNTASPLLGTLDGFGYTDGGIDGTTCQSAAVATSTGQFLTVTFTSDGTVSGQNASFYGGWNAIMGCEPIFCGTSAPASDICGTATQICDLNNYCGNTGGWYTAGPESCTLGSDYGGIFCGTIENNSWISFVARGTSASFDITSSNCSSNTSGIQAMIFDTPDCISFTGVSNCINQTTGPGVATLSATGLTAGNTYYIMVDGYAGNNCDYTVVANTGVQVVDVTSSLGSQICTGTCTDLTANATGATSYSWSSVPAGASGSTPTITVCPAVNTTYTATITGVCGGIQTATYVLNVTPPNVDFGAQSTLLNLGTYDMNVFAPQTVSCTDPVFYLVANDSVTAGMHNTPSLIFQFTSDGNSVIDASSVNIYVGGPPGTGTLIYSKNPLAINTVLDVYGEYMGNNDNYYIEICDVAGNGGVDWQVYDGNTATVYGSGAIVTGSPCEVFGPFNPSGSATWVTTAPGGSFGTSDWGGVSFSPSNAGPGTYSFTYNWNSSVGCVGSATHTIQVVNPFTFTSLSYATVCASVGGTVSPSIVATTGGTYSSAAGLSINSATGVVDVSLSTPGTYTVSYFVGTALPSACNVTGAGQIIINTNPTAVISGGGTICIGGTTPNVSIALTGNSPWSITYSVGGTPTTVSTTTSPYIISNGIDGTYTVIAVSDANCTGTFSGSATILTNPIPTATLSGGGTICAGSAIPNISIALTGSSPWNITYSISGVPTTVSTSTSPYVISGGVDGTYTITALSDANCTGIFSGSATILTNPIPTATLSGGGTICAGSAIPNISIALTGNSPWNITYSISGTPTTVSTGTSPYVISGGSDGTYMVTAVSDVNCTGTFSGSATILTNPIPTATLSGGGTICAGSTTPSLSIAFTGTPPWNVTYTDGTTPVTVTGVLASPYAINGAADGTYTLTASADANCTGTFSGSATILTNPVPTAIISGGGAICAGSAIPNISIALTGSSPWNITYNINGVPTTVSASTSPYVISGGVDGTYTITALSDANCTGTFSGSATILTNPIPTATLSGGGTICAGNATPNISIALTGNSPWSVTYSIGGVPTTVSTSTSPYVISGGADGTYTVTAVSDVNCTGTFSGSATILTNPIPTATLSGGGTICAGNATPNISIALTGNSPWNITYSIGGVPTTVSTSTSPYVISGGSDGTYTVTAVSDANCTGAFSGSATILTNPIPTATLSGGGTICAGSAIPNISIVLTGNSPWNITYSISGTPTTVSTGTSPYVISGGSDGTYMVTAVSDVNCTGTFSGSATILTNPIPTATLSGGGTICAGSTTPTVSIALTGNSPWSVTYSIGGVPTTVSTSTSPYVISGGADGTYTVTAVSDANCTGTFSGSATILTTPLPVAPSTSANATYCAGDPIADMTASGSGGTLTWYSDAGLTTILGAGGALTPASTVGSTNYYVAESTSGGCEGPSSMITVTINALPVIDSEVAVDASTCGVSDGAITITASGGSGSYSYSIDGGVTFTNTTGVFTGLGVNSYQVVIDDGNCQVAGSILNISAPSTPSAPTAGANAVYCEGDVIADLTASTSLGGVLNWYDDAGLTNNVGTGVAFTPATTAGNYTYYVTETTSGCEGASTQITVDVNAVPTATVTGGGTICAGDPMPDVVITLTGSTPWSMTYTDGITPVTVAPGTSPFTLTNPTDGTYAVTLLSDVTGCTGTFTGSVDVITNPALSVDVSGGGIICSGGTIPDVTFTFTGTSPWNVTYSDGTTPTTVSVTTSPYVISGATDGIYTITSLTDPSGCPATITGSATILTNPVPIATVTGGGTVCATDPTPDVTITLTGTSPWNVTYDVSGTPTSVVVASSPYTISGGADGTYTVISLTDLNCIGTANGSAIILTNALPTAAISGGGVICAGSPTPDVTIALTGTGPWSVTYFDGTNPTTVSTNSSNYIISNGIDGTYTVTNVSDVNCTGIASGVATITTSPLPTAVVTGGGTICAGEPIPDVIITLTGTSPWTLTYTDGVTPTTVTVSSSPLILSNVTDGAYSVTSLTDVSTCTATSMIGVADVITNIVPTAVLSGGGTICSGNLIPDVIITLTGNGPWDVTYTDGSSPTIVTVNTSPYVILNGIDGNYSISAMNDVNCIGAFSGSANVLTNTTPPEPTAGTDATYCFGDPIVDLFAGGTGGALNWFSDAGLTISIGSGTSLTPPNLVIGATTYYVTETNLGCESLPATVIITVNDVPTITSELATDVSGCNITDGTIDIVVAGGTPAYTYSIDGGITFTNTTGNFSGLDVNSYQVVVADQNCQTTGSLLVVSGPGIPPAPVAGVDATYCEGDAVVDLTATAGSGGALSWYDDAGLTNLVGNSATFTPANTVGTATYYVTERVANCESPSTQITVTINPTPLAPVAAGGNTYCEGDAIVDLTAPPSIGGTMNWYDDAGLTNLVFTGQVYSSVNAVGNYTYYVTETLNGCTGPSTLVNVVIQSTPVFTVASTNPTVCSGTDGTLLISGLVSGNSYAVSYTENGSAVAATNIIADANGEILINGLIAGTFTSVAVDLNGCSTTDVTVFTLIDPAMPTFTILANSPTVCAGTDGDLTLSGLTPNTSYDITYLDDGVAVNATIVSDGVGNIVIGTLNAGIYTDVAVSLTGCTTTLAGPYSLVDPNAPTFSIGATTNPSGCGVADASITINGLIPNTTYNLTYDVNGVTVGPTSLTTDANGDYVISGIQGGNYSGVTIELSSCSSTDGFQTVLAPIYPTAPVAFTDSAYCEGDVIADLNGIPAFGGSMTWYDDAGLTNQVGTGSAYVVLDTAPGTYTYYVTETLSNCEGSSSSVTVIISPTPSAPGISSDAIYCEGDVIADLVATPQVGGVITWYSDSLLTDSIGTGATYTPATGVDTVTYYAVEEVSSCVSVFSNVTVTVTPNPAASFTATPNTGSIPLDVYFDNTSTGGTTYAWDLGDGTTSVLFDPSVSYTVTDNYIAVLAVTDANGCVDTTSALITVEGVSELIIPNIFTPNGDGENDVFNLSGTNISKIEGTIMNRWGQVIYQFNALEAGWTGRTVSGLEASEGTYYYIIYAEGADGQIYDYQGPFQLIR